jgi:hypothetical protein
MEGIPMSARPPVPAGLHTVSPRLPVEGELRSLSGATGWLNSPPLTVAALRAGRSFGGGVIPGVVVGFDVEPNL